MFIPGYVYIEGVCWGRPGDDRSTKLCVELQRAVSLSVLRVSEIEIIRSRLGLCFQVPCANIAADAYSGWYDLSGVQSRHRRCRHKQRNTACCPRARGAAPCRPSTNARKRCDTPSPTRRHCARAISELSFGALRLGCVFAACQFVYCGWPPSKDCFERKGQTSGSGCQRVARAADIPQTATERSVFQEGCH